MRPLLGFMLAGALPACTLVEGDRILGREFAAEHTAFAAVDANLDLGPAPVAGARRTFEHFELERIAREHSVELTKDASRHVCFERVTVRLTVKLLRTALGAPDIEILDFSSNALPVGKPEFPSGGLTSSGLWRGRWLYGDNRSVPIWVRVRAPGSFVPEPTSTRAIERGHTVKVEVRTGGVLLAFEAAAESSGHVGEQVTVRNPANGQRFRAIVEAPGKVGIQK